MTDEKVPTPAQRQNRKNASSDWHLSTVKLILQNPVYVGDMIAQRTTVAALGSNKRKRQPQEEWVFLKDSHPPLVSREQFQLVNNLLSRRAFGKTKGKDRRKKNGWKTCLPSLKTYIAPWSEKAFSIYRPRSLESLLYQGFCPLFFVSCRKLTLERKMVWRSL
ncbi:recombinase family protein [Paenibacillus sp.]|uniref:recombinase family protein n=1 Tax=Paenibacillus sp. TaxID=58172 RepID=UPI0035697A32